MVNSSPPPASPPPPVVAPPSISSFAFSTGEDAPPFSSASSAAVSSISPPCNFAARSVCAEEAPPPNLPLILAPAKDNISCAKGTPSVNCDAIPPIIPAAVDFILEPTAFPAEPTMPGLLLSNVLIAIMTLS